VSKKSGNLECSSVDQRDSCNVALSVGWVVWPSARKSSLISRSTRLVTQSLVLLSVSLRIFCRLAIDRGSRARYFTITVRNRNSRFRGIPSSARYQSISLIRYMKTECHLRKTNIEKARFIFSSSACQQARGQHRKCEDFPHD
jgi:hypothetical protein